MFKLVTAAVALAGMTVIPSAQAVFSDSQKVLSVFTEQGDKAETSGFAIGLRKVERNDFYLQLGLSYQRITLTQQPVDYTDGRIRPLFLYGRLGMDWKISPYFQAGIDLNGSVKQWFDDTDQSCCNATLKTGLEFKLHDNIRLDLYGNWYNLRYKWHYDLIKPGNITNYAENRRLSRTTIGAQLAFVF
ncbi:hypothetical protein [Arsukibacterium sp.]|uniref:hypothetical protein n=1 Tax=Arsukibacterium sp. TaxID=1977258 RepID=UPI00299D466E|nr:hypothetical protein [Arsukibacterium sp.]MDX1538292.1 hypothetical protein [Arsukibacterium sp.]